MMMIWDSPRFLLGFILLITVTLNCAIKSDHQTSDTLNSEKSRKVEISKRSVIGLASVVKCATRRNPFDYNDYGCFCGLGNRFHPIDDIDRCCQAHDECYGVIRGSNGPCKNNVIYTHEYEYKCEDSTPTCAKKQADECGRALCECDVRLAQCFTKFPYPGAKPSCPTPSSFKQDLWHLVEKILGA